MRKTFWIGALVLAGMVARAATNDLTTTLQKGLFEEEANRNLEAAIQAYQSVANQFDKDRRLAATAIFRLGECYRKQGNTNGAAAQFERVVREFADQSALVSLSRQNLAGLGQAKTAASTSGSGNTNGSVAEELALESQLALLNKLTPPELLTAVQQNYPDPLLTSLLQKRQEVQQQVVRFQEEFSSNHPTRRATEAQLEDLNHQINDHVKGVLAGLQFKLQALKSQREAAKAAMTAAAPRPQAEGEAASLTTSEAEEVKRIQALIKDSPDLINASDEAGRTPLHRAVIAGQLVVAQFLLANGANTEAKDTWGKTSLSYAASAGHKALVELLLSKKADVRATDKGGYTALHWAAEKGYRSVAEVLLAHGATVEATTPTGTTPLLLAAAQGFRAMVELLLAHGANINAAGHASLEQPNRGFEGTALIIAAQRGDQALAEFLLAKGTKVDAVNKDGKTALSYAAAVSAAGVVKALLGAHADPNAGRVNLPLACAAWKGDVEIIKLLLAAGANPNTRSVQTFFPPPGNLSSESSTFTPLFMAVHEAHAEAVKALLAGKANPNGPGAGHATVLFWALSQGPTTLQALLDGGADPNLALPDGTTPLQSSTQQQMAVRATTVGLLLAHGADPNVAGPSGWLPLHSVTEAADTNAMALLLQKGADVEARLSDGRTPLYIAVDRQIPAAVKLLLEHKANPNARNTAGTTVLEVAKRVPAPPWVLLPNSSLRPPGTTASSTQGTSAGSEATPAAQIVALLRQYGALEDLPRLDAIELRRPSTHYSEAVFTRDTNAANQFTLAEALGVEYALLEGSVARDSQRSSYGVLGANGFRGVLSYPDLAHVRLRKPAPDLKSWQERTVDLTPLLESGVCSNDVVLSWGEVVEIPEQDHPLKHSWRGFTTKQLENLLQCLSRQVEIVVKGQSTKVALGPKGRLGQGVWPEEVSCGTLWLRPTLLHSALVLASSDLARVKLIRRDKATGQKREWVVDCTNTSPGAPDFWLQEGDVIEVPEKGQGYGMAEPQGKR